jgi:hypothetical protein
VYVINVIRLLCCVARRANKDDLAAQYHGYEASIQGGVRRRDMAILLGVLEMSLAVSIDLIGRGLDGSHQVTPFRGNVEGNVE